LAIQKAIVLGGLHGLSWSYSSSFGFYTEKTKWTWFSRPALVTNVYLKSFDGLNFLSNRAFIIIFSIAGWRSEDLAPRSCIFAHDIHNQQRQQSKYIGTMLDVTRSGLKMLRRP
jgi:hypothetical protein